MATEHNYNAAGVNATTLTLNDGNVIPQIGIGVYQVPAGAETERVVTTALELGYRHIDTAHAYQNERSVGKALRESGLDRKDVWVTSKLWPSEYGRGTTSQAIDKMLDRLGLEQLDLLLLHQQFGDFLEAWADMEDAVRDGRVRSIGLSNFESDRLEQVLDAAQIQPAVNQVECHPFYPQDELRKRMAAAGTIVESWYPLGHGAAELLNHPLFVELAERYGKTPAQIVLRWHIQYGNVVFPRSLSREHMAENLIIFDFVLSDADMQAIAGVNTGTRFFNMTVEEQERVLSGFVPQD